MDALEELYLEQDEAISRKLAAEELRLAKTWQNESARLFEMENMRRIHKEDLEMERRKWLDEAARHDECVAKMEDRHRAANERYRIEARELALATESKIKLEKARDQQKADKILAKSEQR